jgi:predicted nucleotidyltransferase component of viral defense system
MKWNELKKQIQSVIADPKSEFANYDFDETLSLLIRERFMARVPYSDFNDSIILKGGLLLTMLYTKSTRYTGDADISLRNAYELADYQEAIDSILSVDLNDSFSFSRNTGEILSSAMREYDGAAFAITCLFDGKQRTRFILDIGVGDAVKPVDAKLPTLTDFEASSVQMKIYPPETIAAEKWHAIVVLGTKNTRLKDFYDLFMLRDHVDKKKFTEARKQTFERRKTILAESLPPLPMDKMQSRWELFLKAKQYRIIKEAPKDFEVIYEALEKFYGTKKA